MSDPATTGNELATRDPELDRYARLGQWMAMAEEGRKDPRAQGAAAALKLYFAKELGLPPWAASQILFQRGQLGGTVELKRALAREAGYDVKNVKQTADSCTAAVVERSSGKEIGRATFTMAQAKKAGLIRDGSAWTTYPERMLWARAAGWAMKDAIPEVVVGLAGEDDTDEVSGIDNRKSGHPGHPHEPVDLVADEYAEDADFEPIPGQEEIPVPPDPPGSPAS